MRLDRAFLRFTAGSAKLVVRGSAYYYAWIGLLLLFIGVGITAYTRQMEQGLIATNIRDEVSWAFYIGNFTFLVGVAAAAVLLVIPAYIYHWGPIKEVVLIGELLAISALAMCLLFIQVDMGRPDRLLHMMPFIGTPNWPRSMLTWDALVLNVYLILNLAVDPGVRRRGAGRRLLGAMLNWMASEGAREVFLEVRASNVAALALYERSGFRHLGIRKGYYAGPREDALTMVLEMGPRQALE